MLIEIQCGNFAVYDADKREYMPCGEKIIVSGDKVGQLVTCPKCHQEIEVPFGIGATSRQDESPSKPEAKMPQSKPQERPGRSGSSKNRSRDPDATPAKKRRPSSPLAKRPTKKAKPATRENRNVSPSAKSRPVSGQSKPPKSGSRYSAPGLEDSGELFGDSDLALAEPVKRPSSDVMALDFPSEEKTNTLAEDRQERCKKCGNIAKSGRCTVCKHVEAQFEKLHQPMHEIEIETTGLQRWFCRTMNEGVSIKFLEYGSHLALGTLGLALVGLAIISLLGFALGSFGGVALLVTLFAMAGLYAGLVYKGHQFLRDPHAKLAWFQVPFWYLMLVISRAMNWQAYDKSLKGRKIITMRGKQFGDNEIADLPGLKACQVLDLEGTSITDQGLLQFYQLNHLQCLVLRRTNVTHEGVFRLQQSCPRLWVWY